MRDQALTRNLRSRLLDLYGFLYAGQERREEAIALFRQSYRAYPHPENGSLDALKQWGVPVEP